MASRALDYVDRLERKVNTIEANLVLKIEQLQELITSSRFSYAGSNSSVVQSPIQQVKREYTVENNEQSDTKMAIPTVVESSESIPIIV
jgi:hypothetical protein